MTSEEIIKFIAHGKSQTVEFKFNLPIEPIIAEVFAAFSNTDGGILLIGVDDKGNIIGLSDKEADHAIHRLRKISSSLLPYPASVGKISIQSKNVVYAKVDKVPEPLFPVMTATAKLLSRNKSHNIGFHISTFGTENLSVKANKKINAFIAMSFREEEEPALVDYYKAMKRAVESTGLPIMLRRVDLIEGDYEISQKIMDEIDRAQILIADLTLNGRNVYFELGYARAKKCQIIQTARKDTLLEFDIRNWKTLFYRNATELEEKLIPEFKNAYFQVIENSR